MKCSVKECKPGNSVKYFSFPEEITNAWIIIVNKPEWTPSKRDKICSQHFSPGDIVSGRFLRKGAVPTKTVFPGYYFYV